MTGANLTDERDLSAFSQPLVNNSTQTDVNDNFLFGADLSLALFGAFTNIINMVVYMKLGIKDSITVQSLVLSISDFAFCISCLAIALCFIIRKVAQSVTVIDYAALSYCISQAREKAYSMSVTIVFLMSIERCFCVAFPFTVKLLFTKSRSIKIVVCMSIIYVTLLIPEYLTIGMAWIYDKRFNSTRLLLWLSSDRSEFELFKNTVLAGFLPIMTGITATISVVYIISAVKSSNNFRQNGNEDKDIVHYLKKRNINKGDKLYATEIRLSSKDIRMARTVIAIDIIFALCNIPKCAVLAVSVVVLYIPEFSILVANKYHNVVILLLTTTYVFETINGSCTFLIYYAFSTKFRTTLSSIFCNLRNTSQRGSQFTG